MKSLPDPKHEAFATLRASGHDLASAYIHAGYSVKNVKSRARKLVRNPNIQARIAHLQTCLPRIAELHDHHCPTLLLMPETRHEMLVWLWQVMNGTRLIKPAQMRAAGLYCRLQGWHLAKLLPEAQVQAGCPTAAPDAADKSPIPASTLTESEKFVLAVSNQENIAHEHTGKPRTPENLARYQSALANLAHPDAKKDPFGRPLPDIPDVSASTPAPVSSTNPPIHQSSNPPIQQSPASTPSPNPRPVNPANPAILSKNPQPESPQIPAPSPSVLSVPSVLSSPTPSTPPVNPATLSPACGTDPASAGLSKNPQSNPHPKPLTLNRLPANPPQPRTFLNSLSSIPSCLNLPPRKSPRPLAAAL